MALSSCPTSFLPLLLCVALSAAAADLGSGGRLGGRTEIANVKNNKEVQALGKYCVQEYQRKHNCLLSFSEVVEAQKQVVAGIKYYLKISALQDVTPKKFDAVVVVKPWLHSKQLLSFVPSK